MAQKQERSRNGKLTELKRHYEQLQAWVGRLESSERRLTALCDMSSLITQTLEVEQVIDSAIEKIAEVMSVDACLIFLLNQETDELELLAHRGVSAEFAAAVDRVKIGEGFNGKVAASGEAMAVEDTSRDPRLSQEQVRREGLHAHLIVPLRSKDMIIGTLCVAAHQPRRFHAEDIELLTIIGNAIGVVIENASLCEEQRRTATELQTSERKYRTLFESASDAICVHDMEGNILATNRACADLTGYSLEELNHMNVRSFFLEDALTLAKQVRERLLRGEIIDKPYEQRLIRNDGTEASLMMSASLIVMDGRPMAFQVIARDVTEEKRIQENLMLYVQQVVRAQEEERKRVARELHDDTAQVLASLSRQLDNFIRKRPHLPADDLFFLKDLQVQLNRGLQDVHRFTQDLRPSILDNLGLLPALRSLINEVKKRDGIDTTLEVLGVERRFTPEVELLIYRIVQEALSNIRRHAQASRAWVVMEFSGGKTKVSISDNGHGFELTGRLDDLPRSGKLGLAGIQERARLLGGTLELRSAPGTGTTVIVEMPN